MHTGYFTTGGGWAQLFMVVPSHVLTAQARLIASRSERDPRYIKHPTDSRTPINPIQCSYCISKHDKQNLKRIKSEHLFDFTY